MKILHIGPSEISVLSDKGGAVQRRMLGLAGAQTRRGHEVVVASPERDRTDHQQAGWRLVGVTTRRRRPLRDYEFLFGAYSRLRTERFDVVHVHGSPDGARVLSRLAHGPIVQSVDFFRYRLTHGKLGHRYYQASLNRYDALMPVSDYCADVLRSYYPALRAPVSVVPNGVDLGQFRPDSAAALAAKDALRLPSGPLVVYLGRITAQKGSDLLGPLAARLRHSHPEATVVAAGPGEQFGREELTPLMRELANAGVVVTGAVHENHLNGLLSAATVCVLPTRADEMFGMAALEALAAGTPVVASHLGGIPEAVGDVGRTFPVGDIKAFHQEVSRYLDSGSDDDFPSLARAHVDRFSWDRIAEMTDDVVTAVAKSR